jgi:phosphoglycolate phosphatase
MKYAAIIFDFDFTLADATLGIVSSVNYGMSILEFVNKSEEDIRKTVGMTLKNTFHVLTGITDDALASRFVALFKEKADLVMTENTKLISDTISVLSSLKAVGCKTGIVTNKFHYRM